MCMMILLLVVEFHQANIKILDLKSQVLICLYHMSLIVLFSLENDQRKLQLPL